MDFPGVGVKETQVSEVVGEEVETVEGEREREIRRGVVSGGEGRGQEGHYREVYLG